MSKHYLLLLSIFSVFIGTSYGQLSGSVVYNNNSSNIFKVQGSPTGVRVYQSDTSIVIQARVLMNQKADFYVLTFGLSDEAPTVKAAIEVIDDRISSFTSSLKSMSITNENYYVDFVAQNRVYDYEVDNNTAVEKITGFEIKKNIIIKVRDHNAIAKICIAAADFGIYDLIKVDYTLDDLNAIRPMLFEKASRIIKDKKSAYFEMASTKLKNEGQVHYEDFQMFNPSEQYKGFKAFETNKVNSNYYSRRNLTMVEARKLTTHYYQPFSPSGFDQVINHLIIEPAIQFIYVLEVRYELER